MRATVASPILISMLLLALPAPGDATSDEAQGAPTSGPAIKTSTPPVTPGRPHASSFDPHGKLDPETQIQIALQHKLEGRPLEALSTLGLAIAGDSDNARLYAVRGSILLEQDRVAPALSDLERAVKLDPEDVEALTNRAQAYRRFGRIEQALADLDRAIAVDPDLLAARFNRGAMRYGIKDLAGALQDFDYCIALDPHLPGPYFNRATVQDAMGNKEAAITDLERFLRISRNDAWNSQAKEMLEALRNPERVPAAPLLSPHQ